jgi:hypothetical protein
MMTTMMTTIMPMTVYIGNCRQQQQSQKGGDGDDEEGGEVTMMAITIMTLEHDDKGKTMRTATSTMHDDGDYLSIRTRCSLSSTGAG